MNWKQNCNGRQELEHKNAIEGAPQMPKWSQFYTNNILKKML